MKGSKINKHTIRNPLGYTDVDFYYVERQNGKTWIHDNGYVYCSVDEGDGPYRILEFGGLYLDPDRLRDFDGQEYYDQEQENVTQYIRDATQREAEGWLREMLKSSIAMPMSRVRDGITPEGAYYDATNYTQACESGLPILQIYEDIGGTLHALSQNASGEYIWGRDYRLEGEHAGFWSGGRYKFDLDDLIRDEVYGRLVIDNVGWGDLNRKKWE